jgi:predicted Zn-dependent protease
MGFGRQTVRAEIEYGPYWERYDQSSPYYSARKKDGISQAKIEQVAERAARRTLNKEVRRRIASGEISIIDELDAPLPEPGEE